MGQEAEAETRMKIFPAYQVNAELLAARELGRLAAMVDVAVGQEDLRQDQALRRMR